MNSIKKWTLCKALAVVLSLLIAGEASVLMAAQGAQQDPLETAFAQGREAYFAEKYEDAKNILEKLVSDLAAIEGRDSFKGTTYLLMGATYEQLKLKELAIKYFCKAKAILGEGKTIEGLDLKKLKYYKNDCTSGAGVIAGQQTTVKRRGFLGGLLGTLLFLSVLGAGAWLLWKYVLKKDEGSSTTTYTSACFSTEWHFDISSTWSGSLGDITLTPSNTAPQPNENNNWTDQVTYTVSKSGGGTLVSMSVKLSVTVKGGDNGKRRDLVWVDNVQKLDQTNTFAQPCSAGGSADYNNIYEMNAPGSFTLKHQVQLSTAQNVHGVVTITKR
jgi:hypothetical protein